MPAYRISTAAFATLTETINKTVWWQAPLALPEEGAKQNNAINTFLLRMATQYFEVSDVLQDWEVKAIKLKDYTPEGYAGKMTIAIERLATFVRSFPSGHNFSLRKMHYLFLLYVFCERPNRFYVFGGFVRDLYHRIEPVDCDVWMSHHCDHTDFAEECAWKLGYTVKWLHTDGSLQDEPIERRSDYGAHHEGFRLILAGFDDILMFDISLAGTFESLGVDFACNSLYIEMDSVFVPFHEPVAASAATSAEPEDDQPSGRDIFRGQPLSIAVRAQIIVYHPYKCREEECDDCGHESSADLPFPYVGCEGLCSSRPTITYDRDEYVRPQAHRVTQAGFPHDLLTRIPKPQWELDQETRSSRAEPAISTADEKTSHGKKLIKFRMALKGMEAAGKTLRMPSDEDKANVLTDIIKKIARPVTWGHQEEVIHRIEKMKKKGYKVIIN